MKSRFLMLLATTLFATATFASTTWYVDGDYWDVYS